LNGGWSVVATAAIQKLKKEARSLPKFKPPGTGKLILQIDSSDEYWGAVLLEKEENQEEQICSYKSSEFSSSQKKYFTTKKKPWPYSMESINLRYI